MTAHPHHKKLARILDRMGGLFTLNDILRLIGEGQMQSFAYGDSWAITRIAVYPRARVLEILFALGDLEECRILHERVLDFALAEGIGIVQAYGRKGWLPDAARRGWKIKARNFVYSKEL